MPLARVKGRVLFIADDGRRYVPGSAPWRKFLNEARAAGQQPFETIVLDNNMWALNPATSGKGSRDPLVLIDTNGKGEPTARGAKRLEECSTAQDGRRRYRPCCRSGCEDANALRAAERDDGRLRNLQARRRAAARP